MKELNNTIHERITKLCEEGDNLSASSQFRFAIRKYHEALELLPDPKTDWEAGTWIIAAIADAQFLSQKFEDARQTLVLALSSYPLAVDNPFFHLRYGQCLYELERFDLAADYLCGVFAIEGTEMFEDEDPKYRNFLKTRIKPVSGK